MHVQSVALLRIFIAKALTAMNMTNHEATIIIPRRLTSTGLVTYRELVSFSSSPLPTAATSSDGGGHISLVTRAAPALRDWNAEGPVPYFKLAGTERRQKSSSKSEREPLLLCFGAVLLEKNWNRIRRFHFVCCPVYVYVGGVMMGFGARLKSR